MVQLTRQATPDMGKLLDKLPPLAVDKPALWFTHEEAEFLISRITSEDTKTNILSR